MIAHVVAGNRTDLEVALGFLKISKSIKDHGDVRESRGAYVCTVRLARPYKDVSYDISARFGRFVQIRKE